jgi:hypothetical protein
MAPGLKAKRLPKSVKWTKRIKSLPHRDFVGFQPDDFLASFFHSRDTLPGTFPLTALQPLFYRVCARSEQKTLELESQNQQMV